MTYIDDYGNDPLTPEEEQSIKNFYLENPHLLDFPTGDIDPRIKKIIDGLRSRHKNEVYHAKSGTDSNTTTSLNNVDVQVNLYGDLCSEEGFAEHFEKILSSCGLSWLEEIIIKLEIEYTSQFKNFSLDMNTNDLSEICEDINLDPFIVNDFLTSAKHKIKFYIYMSKQFSKVKIVGNRREGKEIGPMPNYEP